MTPGRVPVRADPRDFLDRVHHRSDTDHQPDPGADGDGDPGTAPAGSVGTWSRAILASSDYRYYASRNAADTPVGRDNYRFVAR